MISKVLAGMLLVSGSIAAAESVSFTSCDSSVTYPVTINSIDVTPYPIIKGEDVTITVAATIADTYANASFDATVSYLGIKLVEISESFCTYTTCPITPGDISLKVVESVTSLAPSVTVAIKVTGTDTSSNTLFCDTLSAKITSAAELEEAILKVD